jgi:hypothetical protein
MKKQSTAKQILNILNTQGGKKPKQLVASIKATPASVYTAISKLRSVGLIAKEDDGVYITQTQTSVGSPSTTKPKLRMATEPVKTAYTKSLETQVHELEKLHEGWRQNYKKLEADYTQAKIMYLDSQAVVKYLEEKVAQLIKG